MDRDSIQGRLHHLTERLNDGKKEFSYAGNSVEHTMLRKKLFELAQQRAHFASELNELTSRFGGDPEGRGTFIGTVHRQWLAFKAELKDHPDHYILSECIRGEQKALDDYEEALNKGQFPPDVLAVLRRQHDAIRSSCAQLKQLEESMD